VDTPLTEANTIPRLAKFQFAQSLMHWLRCGKLEHQVRLATRAAYPPGIQGSCPGSEVFLAPYYSLYTGLLGLSQRRLIHYCHTRLGLQGYKRGGYIRRIHILVGASVVRVEFVSNRCRGLCADRGVQWGGCEVILIRMEVRVPETQKVRARVLRVA
jgi:hypothetical protein